MAKKYRTKLTDEEYNAVLHLTSAIKVDSEFDLYDCGETDKFKDWGDGRFKSLKRGFKLLDEAIVYPLAHEGLTRKEALLITNLLVEFTGCGEKQIAFLMGETD